MVLIFYDLFQMTPHTVNNPYNCMLSPFPLELVFVWSGQLYFRETSSSVVSNTVGLFCAKHSFVLIHIFSGVFSSAHVVPLMYLVGRPSSRWLLSCIMSGRFIFIFGAVSLGREFKAGGLLPPNPPLRMLLHRLLVSIFPEKNPTSHPRVCSLYGSLSGFITGWEQFVLWST